MDKDITSGIQWLHSEDIVHLDLQISSGVPPFKDMTGPIEIALHVISGKREASIDETPIDYINLYHRAWNDEASLLSNINEIHNKFNDMKMEPFVDIDNISNQDFKTIDQIIEDVRQNHLTPNQNSDDHYDIGRALISHGDTYFNLSKYEKLLADLNKLLEIASNNTEAALAFSGTIYCYMDIYE
ncbi:hypothetical protein C2G38_2027286 [Gigaspora rosea]|uniref:Uncharacterized protein n=1 Tax=Gigaspora rosea TaxID=44941 RepID=A0A397W7A1_9GLOM|nr:hypothetical protein C2G38_2027286 [Gigaspora rosea]